MAIKKKAAVKKEAKKEVKTRDFHAIGDNKNDLKMVVYGEGSEAGDYISYFALLIINGLQVSGTLKLSTNEEKGSFFCLSRALKIHRQRGIRDIHRSQSCKSRPRQASSALPRW